MKLYAGQEPDAEYFTVHKSFACFYSPALHAALNSNFIEGKEQFFRLDEDDFETVRLLVHWFYTQVLDTQQPTKVLEDKQKTTEETALVKLWILADKLLIRKLQNNVCCKIHQIFMETKSLSGNIEHYLYDNTESDSPLRQWFAGLLITELSPEDFTRQSKHFRQEFLVDLANILCRSMSPYAWRDLTNEVARADFTIRAPNH